MIKNIPDPTELEEVSLRLLFKAWNIAVEIVTEWDEYVNRRQSVDDVLTLIGNRNSAPLRSDAIASLENERISYIGAAQNDLQAAYVLIQQCHEIALKSRLCRVSPYLILKSNILKKTANSSDYDFLAQDTVGAYELPKVHDTFCDTPLSDAFKADYDDIRTNRNILAHIGITNNKIDPLKLFSSIILSYRELFNHRRWWNDRIIFIFSDRWHHVGHTDDWTEKTSALYEFHGIEKHLTDEQFAFIMGNPRSSKRFICFECVSDANLEEFTIPIGELATAYKIDGENSLCCSVCLSITGIRPLRCADADCSGLFVCDDGRHKGSCATCGWTREAFLAEAENNRHFRKREDE